MLSTLLLAPLMVPILSFQTASQAPPVSEPIQSVTVVGYDHLEVQANTFTSNRQQDPAAAADANGNLLVAWGSRRQEQGSFGVFAQLLDPRGRPLGTELHVNQFVQGEQAKPAVAFAADGTAMIVWHSVNQFGEATDIYARRFGVPEGGTEFEAIGDEFLVNQLTPGDQMNSMISSNAAGEMMISWTGFENQRRVIRARLFASDGTPKGNEFRLSDQQDFQEGLVSVAPSSNGFVAVWAKRNIDGYPEGLVGCQLDTSGDKIQRKPFTVSTGADAFDVEPSVDSSADGSFVVAWMSSQDGEAYTAKAQRFQADATPLGATLTVDAGGTGSRSGAQVAVAPDGRFVVAYNSNEVKQFSSPGHRPTKPVSIRAQRFAADGSQLGDSFRMNQFNEGEQTLQVGVNAKHLLWTAKDQLVAAWHGNAGDDHRAVGLSILVPEDFNPPAPPAIEPRAAGLDITVDMVHGPKAKPDYDPNFIAPVFFPPPLASGGSGGFEAIQNTGWTPPDPDLAVGPNHIVTVANGEISFFDKLGNQSFSDTIAGSSGFWGSVGAGGFVFDPVALFDPHTNRFIVAAADGAGTNDSIVLAMSDDDDPNGTWHKYRFPVSSTCVFLDFPNLGVNDEAIFLAGDCFSGGGNRIFMWDKSKVMNGQTVSMKQVNTAGSPISLGASKNYDSNSPAYFASTYSSSSNKLMIKAVRNPNTSPILSQYELTVPSFAFPPGAAQLGTSNQAATIDWRVKNGVVRDGSFWVVHNTGANSTARVRWYEIALNGWPTSGSNPTLIQSSDLNFGTGQHNWFGDINVGANGDAVIAFNRSSSSQYIGIEYVTRKAGDPLGTMSPPKELVRSTSAETGSRWGDYSGVEQDPVDPNTFWSHHEYRTNSWRTWVGEFSTMEDLALTSRPVTAGSTTILTVNAANPGETVHFLASLSLGSTAPPQLGGLVLDLGSVIYLGSSSANGSGTASYAASVPGGAPVGVNAYLQATARRGIGGVDSVKSNLVTEVIQ
ncbi:MAG: hypothetical protein GY747_03405 [Planctomycetes bacterium]|nr:hypothetical protein [Planctomycetota bacterium]